MAAGTVGDSPVSITNWQIRRALEEAAWYPPLDRYVPAHWVEHLPTYLVDQFPSDLYQPFGWPIPEQAPWLQAGWGVLTLEDGNVVGHALAHLGFPDGTVTTPRTKSAEACDFQTAGIQLRKLYWDQLAVTSDSYQNAPDPDPFLECN